MRSAVHSAFGAGAVIIVWAILASATTAAAQETIFDPENPGMAEEADETSTDDGDDDNGADDDSDDDEDAADPMVIHDPERPELPDETDAEEDEQNGKKEEVDESPSASPGVGFRETEWSLDYEVGTLLDPGFGPEGRHQVEWVGALAMSLRHNLSNRSRAVVSGEFQYWAGNGRDDEQKWQSLYEARLSRAYLRHRRDAWSFALGKMRNSWGSTDIVRPGDVIDPVDIRDPGAADGVGTALGQLSATAAYTDGDWTLRAVVVPFFREHEISLFGRDTSLGHQQTPVISDQLPMLLFAEQFFGAYLDQEGQSLLVPAERPGAVPRNVSAGLRSTWTVSGTDLGLGAFVGWDRTPYSELDDDLQTLLMMMMEDGQFVQDFDVEGFLQRNPEAQPHFDAATQRAAMGQPLVESAYRRRATLLADMARYVGPIGVRADVAFSPRQVFLTEEFQSVRRPSLFAALGFSHERLLDGVRPLAITVEGFWLHPFGADSPVSRALVDDDERGDASDELLLFDGGYYGLATALNWATGWRDWEVVIGGVASISPGDFIGRLALEKAWRPELRTTVGMNLFVGPEPERRLTPGGYWAHNDRVYLGLSGRF